MQKILVIIGIVILALVGIYFIVFGMGGGNKGDSAISQTSDTELSVDTGNSQTHNIEIKGFAFSPKTLIIKKGDTVVWTNMDSAKHTATSDSGSELNSALLNKGETYSHTFDQTGTYDSHCTVHPYMKGTIIVE